MKKLYYLALAAVVGIALSSCKGSSTNEPKFKLSDLQGLWQRTNSEEFVRFTTEQSDEANYLLGLEWNEAEDVHESDRWESRETLGHPGNGWFKYWFETKDGGLHELHLMDNEGAVEPKEYIVSKLTSTDLEYYEKDRTSWKFSFTKVVESK